MNSQSLATKQRAGADVADSGEVRKKNPMNYQRAQVRGTAELLIQAPSGAIVTKWPLSAAEVTVGRRGGVEGQTPDIELEGRRVSRLHAKVVQTPSGHRIIDLDSTNGVVRNGVRVAFWDFSFGDEVEIGEYRAAYVMATGDPDATVPNSPADSCTARLRVDVSSGRVWVGDKPLPRAPSSLEFKLLAYLYARPGKVRSRDQVGAAVWGEGRFCDLMVHQLIRRVRNKIEERPDCPSYLVNVPGQGYRLDP